MSENPDQVTAAATGAAAAVAAVQDDQQEAERHERMEAETVIASGSAQEAAQEAQQAAEAATAAVEAANEATGQAQQASAVAEQASMEAYDARADVDQLRQTVTAGFGDLREFISARLPDPASQSSEPTEVVVTHDRPDTTAQNRVDTGGNSGAPSTGDGSVSDGTERRPRHRFGSRRGLFRTYRS